MAARTKRMTFRVLLVVGLAFLPAVLLYVSATRSIRELRLETHRDELTRVAAVVQAEYRGIVTRSRALLGSLAELDEVRRLDQPACHRTLASILAHAPWYTTLSAIGVDGYLACGSLTPDDQLYLGDRTYFVRASSGPEYAVGDFHIGRITGRPGVGVALPLLDGDEVVGVVAASIDLTSLSAGALETELPEGASFTVLDADGRIFVREPTPLGAPAADTPGAQAPEGFPAMPEGRQPVSVRGTDPYGFERIYAVAALGVGPGPPQGYLAVGTPSATLMERVNEVTEAQLRWLLLAAAILFVVAWLVGHYSLVRPSEGAA